MNKPKKTWSIGELSKEFEVTARTLRFYEDRGLISPIRDGQIRKYSGRDRARLGLVLRGKRLGLPLDDLRELLDLYDLENGKRNQMESALIVFKKQIKVLEQQKIDIEDALRDLYLHSKRIEELLNKTSDYKIIDIKNHKEAL